MTTVLMIFLTMNFKDTQF